MKIGKVVVIFILILRWIKISKNMVRFYLWINVFYNVIVLYNVGCGFFINIVVF